MMDTKKRKRSRRLKTQAQARSRWANMTPEQRVQMLSVQRRIREADEKGLLAGSRIFRRKRR